MAGAAELAIRISAEDKTGGALGKIKEQAGGAGSALGGVAKIAAGVGVAFMGIQAVKGIFDGVIGGAMEAEKVMKATNTVLTSTKGVSGMTAETVANLATELSKLTPYEDEVIQSAENMLLTFTNLGKDVFPLATETVLNMSEALGQDTKSSAIMLGKALNDPVQGVTALRRVGVQLTDAQEEQVKSFMAVNDIASAQKIILGELETEFGGMARAAGETTAGKMKILQTQIGNVQEAIGGALIPIISGLMEKLIPLATAFAENLPGAMKAFQNTIGAIAEKVSIFLSPLGELVKFITSLVTAIQEGGEVFDVFQEFLEAIGMSEDIARVIAGIAAAFTNLVTGKIDWEEFVYSLSDMGFELERLTGINFGPLFNFLQDIPSLASSLVGIFTGASGAGLDLHNTLERIVGLDVANFFIRIVETLQGAMAEVQKFASEIAPMIGPAMKGIFAIISIVLTTIADLWQKHGDKILNILKGFFTMLTAYYEIGWAIFSGIIKIALALLAGDWQKAWDEMQKMLESIWGSIQKFIGGALDVLGAILALAWGLFQEAAGKAWEIFKSIITGIWDAMVKAVLDKVDEWRLALIIAFAVMEIKLKKAAEDIFNAIVGVLSGLAKMGADWIMEMKDNIVNAIKDRLIPAVRDALGDFMGMFWRSPAKYGPLATIPKWDFLVAGFPATLSLFDSYTDEFKARLEKLIRLIADLAGYFEATMPGAVAGAKAFSDAVRPILEVIRSAAEAMKKVTEITPITKDILYNFTEGIKSLVTVIANLAGWFEATMPGAVTGAKAFSDALKPIVEVIRSVGDALESITEAFKKMIELKVDQYKIGQVIDVISDVMAKIGGITFGPPVGLDDLAFLLDFIVKAITSFTEALKTLLPELGNFEIAMQKAIAVIIDGLQDTVDAFNASIAAARQWALEIVLAAQTVAAAMASSGTAASMAPVTSMQSGGYVTKPTLALLHPGELVIPAKGDTFNIYGNVNLGSANDTREWQRLMRAIVPRR